MVRARLVSRICLGFWFNKCKSYVWLHLWGLKLGFNPNGRTLFKSKGEGWDLINIYVFCEPHLQLYSHLSLYLFLIIIFVITKILYKITNTIKYYFLSPTSNPNPNLTLCSQVVIWGESESKWRKQKNWCVLKFYLRGKVKVKCGNEK